MAENNTENDYETDSTQSLHDDADTDNVVKRSLWSFIFVSTLTFMRFGLVIPAIFLLQSPHQVDIFFAFVLFVLAAQCDWLDGYFARKLGVVSRFGRFADPISDKLAYLTALIALNKFVKTQLIVWIVAVELFLVAHRIWVLVTKRRADVSANWFGKFKSILQNIVICALILGLYLEQYNGSWSAFVIDWIGHMLLYPSLGFSFLSAAGHVKKHSIPSKKK